MSDERCKRGHLIAKVGRTKSRGCKECKREANREYQRRRYHEEPEFRAAVRARKDAWYQRNRARARVTDRAWRDEHREHVREYQRIHAEAKRREAGIPVRTNAQGEPVFYGRNRPPQDHRERVLLPAQPFAEWLRVNVADENLLRWSRAHDTQESLIRKIMDGRQALVHIDTVDRVAVRAGIHLSSIYPELYAEAAA